MPHDLCTRRHQNLDSLSDPVSQQEDVALKLRTSGQLRVNEQNEQRKGTWPMGNLYLLRCRLAMEVDQMIMPLMTSSTASRVVTMIDSEPLTAAMATRTASSTLQRNRQPRQGPGQATTSCIL